MIRETGYKLKKQWLDVLCKSSKRWRKFDPGSNLLIFSYPRSGSTWLAECVNTLPHSALLWEPLHLRNVEAFKKLGFGWRQHIPQNRAWHEAEDTFERLFRGGMLNAWLSSRTFPLKFCTAERMIIKFVRANGLLPWLTEQFQFHYKPIYLVRHPMAIIASQLKEGSWNETFTGFTLPDVPFNEIYKKHHSYLSSLKTKPELMAANWCINNQTVWEDDRHGKDWMILHYEDLLRHPEKELQSIFDQWGFELPDEALATISTPSSTAHESTFRESTDKQLSKWHSFFDDQQKEAIQQVLAHFDVHIYTDGVLPVKDG